MTDLSFSHIDAAGHRRKYERPAIDINDHPQCCGCDMILTQLDETRDRSFGFTCAECGNQERTA